MNDLQLQSRLADLAHDLAPDADPDEQIAGARSLHRRRRRTRFATAGAAVAVALVAIGVPTITGSLSAPDRGGVADRTHSTPAPPSALPTEGDLDSTAQDLRAALAKVGTGPVPDPSVDQPCPDAAGMLSAATGMLAVEPAPLNADSSVIGGCAWSTIPERIGPEKDRYDLILVARPDATADEMRATVEESGTGPDCSWTPLLEEDFFNAFVVCAADDRAEWTLIVVDEDGTGAWELTTAVGTRMPERYGLGLSGTSSLWRLVLSFGIEQDAERNRTFDEVADAIAQRDIPLELRASETPSSDCASELVDLIASLRIELHEVPVPEEGNPYVCGWARSDRLLPMYIGLVRDGNATDRARQLDAAIDTTMREGGTCYASEVSGTATRTTLQACSRPAAGGVTQWRLLVDDAGGAGLWEITALLPDEGAAVDASTSVLALVDLADRLW